MRRQRTWLRLCCIRNIVRLLLSSLVASKLFSFLLLLSKKKCVEFLYVFDRHQQFSSVHQTGRLAWSPRRSREKTKQQQKKDIAILFFCVCVCVCVSRDDINFGRGRDGTHPLHGRRQTTTRRPVTADDQLILSPCALLPFLLLKQEENAHHWFISIFGRFFVKNNNEIKFIFCVCVPLSYTECLTRESHYRLLLGVFFSFNQERGEGPLNKFE
jgi:hypothetical protein